MNNRFTIWKLGQVFNRFMVWFETHSSCILTRGITLSSLNGTAIAFQEFFAELFLPRGEQWIKANKCRAFKNIAIWQTLLSSGASRGTWPWSSSAWLQPAGIEAFKINLSILFVAIFVIVQYSYSYNIYICAIFVLLVTHVGTHSSTFHLWAEAEDMLSVQSSSKDRNIPKGWLAISICYKNNNKIIWDEWSTGHQTIILGL